MIESIIIILIVLAIIFMILAFEWDSITMSITSTIIWLSLAISIHEIEIPYQYESGGTIIEATQGLQGMHTFSFLFIGLGLIMMIYTMYLALEMLKGREVKVM